MRAMCATLVSISGSGPPSSASGACSQSLLTGTPSPLTRRARPFARALCPDSLPTWVIRGRGLAFAGYATPDGRRVGGIRVRVGPPLRHPDQAGLHQVQPVEERGDL